MRRQDCVYGRTDGRTHYYSPLRLTSGDNKWKFCFIFVIYSHELNILLGGIGVRRHTQSWSFLVKTWPRGYKTFFMLNSIEYEFFPAHKCKLPTIVGIFTFMSGKNSILGLPEPKECSFS